ncbi:MAG: amidophosphoribosyltransferase [Lentisphaeraceae bacterium]|nr:amidophosphoribosyltransferase [Lentisphaeraceae bacterium]
MSDPIKHECGIAMVRLLKPLDYYLEKYGTALYGMNKLYLLMEKQHNRGQDGVGVANVKLDSEPGSRYISRIRSNQTNPIKDVFAKVNSRFQKIQEEDPEKLKDVEWLQKNVAFTGEVSLGHLRYGTFGGNTIERCHPFLRENNWRTRSLLVAGNFNLTNVDELFEKLVSLGQHPKEAADTVTVMEKIGHFLDVENETLFRRFKDEGYSNLEISSKIAEEIDLVKILSEAAARWDGGYAMAGIIGHGDAFVLRDPNGIRPTYYYHDDEIAVVTSERPPIQTAFNVPIGEIKELKPGHALIIKKNGQISEEEILNPAKKKSCSFERIYFSRGSDKDIYVERKKLGELLCPSIMKSIDNDVENSVFSFIPNTAETCFFGMMDGINNTFNRMKRDKILKLGDKLDKESLEKILDVQPRREKIAIKDAKLRTFITDDANRDDLVKHVYDITYGTVNEGVDNLVVIDDSIVRGTTLKQSIIRMLERLKPKKIIIVSSAPQIRFPDCYGIDMAKMGDFIAFNAVIALLKESGQQSLIDDVYKKCKAQEHLAKEDVVNYVTDIYKPFTDEDISAKISQLVTPPDVNTEVEVIYQSVENLHVACPESEGDWYFTGDYPTPGGNRVVNRAFINYIEGRNVRAY